MCGRPCSYSVVAPLEPPPRPAHVPALTPERDVPYRPSSWLAHSACREESVSSRGEARLRAPLERPCTHRPSNDHLLLSTTESTQARCCMYRRRRAERYTHPLPRPCCRRGRRRRRRCRAPRRSVLLVDRAVDAAEERLEEVGGVARALRAQEGQLEVGARGRRRRARERGAPRRASCRPCRGSCTNVWVYQHSGSVRAGSAEERSTPTHPCFCLRSSSRLRRCSAASELRTGRPEGVSSCRWPRSAERGGERGAH